MLDDAHAMRAPGHRRRRRLRRDARPGGNGRADRRPRGRSRAAACEYKGTVLEEMDLDAVLARKPEVAVVDELAHTNAPGGKNEKRWQDVEDLLAAGISVMTAVNVQHLEGVQDVVKSATGLEVKERVPDRVIREADAVVNVDLPVPGAPRPPEAGQDLSAGAGARRPREFLPRGEPQVPARARAPRDRGERRPRPDRDRAARSRRSPRRIRVRRRAAARSGRSRAPSSGAARAWPAG